VGYIRISSVGQNTERQLDGVEVDTLFTDTVSGKSADRPQLSALLGFVRDGDTVVVHSMDRLARNLDDLRRLVRELTARGVRVQFVTERLCFTSEHSPMANLLLSTLGAFAEFERALIRERQQEGIALAKARGAYKGRKRSLTPVQVEALRVRAAAGESKASLARELGMSLRPSTSTFARQNRHRHSGPLHRPLISALWTHTPPMRRSRSLPNVPPCDR
jgi:DNA invertase Pin-like site-specific DNA recombinase